MAGALHCGISDTVRFVFGDLNCHNQIPSKDNSRGDAYGCVYTQPECAEGYSCPHAHFWVHQYILQRGYLSVRSNGMAVVGQSHRTGRCRYPVFVCGSNN